MSGAPRPMPLSFSQQRLWFLDQLEPGSAEYVVPFAWRLTGELVVPALEDAITRVVSRHEVLRARFVAEDGEPAQVVTAAEPARLPLLDSGADLGQVVAGFAAEPFDLARGPLWRAGLVRAGERDHVFVFAAHHIVMDAWSARNLVDELGECYRAALAGRQPVLPELTMQYADFARWQRDRLDGAVASRLLAHWRRRLDGIRPLDLPTDRPRGALASAEGTAVEFTVPPEVADGLAKLAGEHRVTLFMTVLAAVQVVLGRYCGQDDVAVGTPIASRGREEAEALIGFFVNTLVLRTDLSGDPTFAELLARVREVALDAYDHEELPFERLVEELHPDRDRTSTPLIQALLVLNTTFDHLELDGLRAEAFPVEFLHSKFDLTVGFVDSPDSLSGWVRYRTELFDAARMTRMCGHLLQVLAAVARDPELRLSGLPLLTDAERAELVPGGSSASEQTEPAHALFEEHAKTSPDVVALSEPDGGSLTYGELNARANRLARHLIEAGAGGPIGICLRRSAEAIVGIVAALKTGTGYVALDPGYPPARLEYLLADSGIDLVLADRDTAAALPPGFAGRTVDPRDPAIDGRPGHDLALPVHPLSIAYVAYTSGSTGRPKGVVATHEAVSTRIRHIRADYELGPADVVLAIAGFGFDASAREILGTLTSGARLVLAGPDAAKDPAGVVGLVASAQVTVIASTVPSVLYELAAQPVTAGSPTAVRLVLCSGERLHAERLAGCSWLAGKVLNQFGPTETTITVTWTRMPAGAGPSWRYDVGPAVGDTTLYVLDDALNPCPVGVPGELYIGGPGLARGYLGQPGLTAERFVPDPFGGGRLYRTGDRCRWSPEHTLEHLGRLDNQLKVRGLRVEPAEIEAALRALEPVGDAVVILREDIPGDQRLTAYFTTSGAPPATSWLHAELERVLPASLVPSVFVALPALPRTVNGKTDRNALPAPGTERPELGAEPVRPRTPAETAVADVWREVLGLDEVGVLDDFFALGGHSLLATHVVARLRSRHGFAVSLRDLFAARTVAKLAALVSAVDPAETGESAAEAPIARSGRRGPAPLSFAQHRLWFLDQLEPGSTDYVIPLGWELSGVVDAGALRVALTEVANRHHTLRTTFTTVDGEPVQVVSPPGPVPFSVLEAGDEELDGLLTGFVAEPFDLSTGPIWRALLVRTGPRRSVFALTIHHIVADAWSAAVFAEEIGRAYQAAVEGRGSAPADLPIQYTDFARWERDRLSGPALDEPLAYWRDRLAGTEVLDLPADRSRPAAAETAGAWLDFTLPAGTAAGLRELARAEGATLFMVVLAGLQAVLARYTGQDDIAVGTPVARRARPETEPLIGMFVNTLVLRTDVGGDPAFTGLLGRVRDTTLGAYEHQDVPFERLVEELRPDRDLTRTPLFQVSLSVNNTPALRLRLPGLALADHPLSTERAKYDLALAFTDNAEEFSGVISYRTALFDERRIERLGEHLRTFFAGVVANPGARLSAIPMLTEDERRTVVEQWGAGPAERPEAAERPGWIHRVLSRHAQEQPDAVAVRAADGGTLGFRELVDRAERLASHLLECGAGPERVVGICLARRPETIVALLAVHRAGAAYLPLDPQHPAERLAATLADAHAEILLTDTAHATELGSRVHAHVVDVDDPATALAVAGHAPAGDPGGHPESLAYVIYTSGSTGTPKGVQITHRGLANYLAWAAGAYPFPRAGGAVLHSSPAFDMTVTSIFLPLLAGRPVQLTEEGADPAGLLPAPGAALVKLTPTHLRVLAGTSPAGVVFPPAVIVGGEDLPAAAASEVLAALPPGGYLVNEYGPTETVVGCCVHTLPAGAIAGPGSVPIGRPIAGTRVHVLDAAMSPCPIGVAGELYIGGAGVARGYRDRPGLTAERFVPDPFGPGRLYRTGDSCRWSPDGHLEYLGRTDFQVKIRGHRVEPGEIEAKLLQQPGVAEAVVVAREDTPDDRRLVAYLVPGADQLDLPALRARLTSSLPGYLIPSAFVVLPALPLSGSGKVDRRALPAPDTARPDLGSGPVPPRGLLEELVADIWSDVLGVDVVGVFDDFFALGGHSLLATQVVSRLARTSGREVPLRLLFEAPTVAGMAQRLSGAGGGTALSPIPHADRAAGLPLSFAQQRLWFLDQFEPGSTEYIAPMAWRLTGDLDPAALEAALAAVVARHEVLRTAFPTVEGKPSQHISAAVAVTLPVLEAGDRSAEQVVTDFVYRPFDLGTGPLWRAAAVRLGPREHVLVLAMHHIVADAWSSGVLVRELSHHYRQGAPALPPLATQYADFSAWQRNWLTGPVLDAQLGHWRDRLAGLTPLELPADRPREAVRSTNGAAIEFTVPAEAAAGLRRLARDHRATLFMVVLAGVQAVLARHSGQHDVAIGTPIAGRNRTEVEDLVGFFVNTLVLRADLSGDPAFTELLERVRTVTLDAYEHQDLPFERLVDELRPERDLARTPLFQVMLTLDNTPPGEWALPGVAVTEFPLGARHAKFDLTFAFTDTPDGLEGVIRYSTALFDAGRVIRLGEHVQRVLGAVARDAGRRLSDLPLLTEREHAQVVDEWNPAGGLPTGSALLHELVERHAAERPDAVAVTDTDGAVLTYAELNRRANRLAHHLRRRGAGPEQLVGLCLERSVRTVVSLLAVLKSGAGYLPLDPAYPAERLAFIIEDARTALVVTDASTATRDWTAEVVNLDDEALTAVLDGLPGTDPRPAMSPQNLAYVIYTSGSTGKPKGVQVTHANATRLFEATRETFGFDEEQVWLSTHSYAFDFSVWEIWGALTTGGRTVIASNAVARDPGRLAAVVAEQRVTMLSQTPTAFRTLMAPLLAGGPGHLRFVVFGGEALDLTTLRPWFDDDRTRDVALVNMYGITETTVHTTSLVLSPSTRGDAAAGPIGRALSDLRTYVLDADLAPCPIGVPGELYVGGAGVTRGYLGRPGLTAERFVPDPFGTGRLYRTGDVGRWSADGVLEYLGRTDRQVKIRGFRIELGEIEARLLESADVAAAVVTAREDKPGERRLVGYVVPAGRTPSVSELRAWLERTLPAHQVPGAFVFLPALPLTATGKVDRRALPAPGAARPELASGFAEPRTPAEELLAGVWAQVLGLDRAGVFDNFFDLGGDSILSIQIVARAVAGGIRITPRMVFEHQTIAALAAAAETAPVVRAEQGAVTGDAPLTPIQHWFFARDLPRLDHYNQSMIVTVPPAATEQDLRLVLARLAGQHDMLRARFTPGPDGWTQSGTAEVPGDLLWTVRCETESALTAEADRLQASLDIRAGRVFGALLADLGPRGRRLLLVAHHLVVDGVSWRVLLEDLETGYRQVRAGLPITLPAKTTSFLQWARMLPEYAVSPAAAEESGFWRKRTGPGAVIAVDHPGGDNTVESAARVSRELSADLTRALLVEVPAAYRTQINDVLLTALALAIRPYATASDVVIDLEGHGREEIVAGVDLSRTVGWFTSIYPVALNTGGGTGIAEVLKETKQALREIPRNGVGHGILRHLTPDGAGLTDSGGQVLFNYLGQFDNVLAADRTFGGAEEARGSGQAPSGRRSHVLELNSEVSGGRFRITVGYSRNLHRAETVDRLADAFVAELAAVIAHCTAPGTTGAVPADFPLAGLDQQTLDLIIDEYRRDV